jgi:hypothetical protein
MQPAPAFAVTRLFKAECRKKTKTGKSKPIISSNDPSSPWVCRRGWWNNNRPMSITSIATAELRA